MKVEIIEKNENPITEREEIKFEIEHKNAPTPSRGLVIEELSSELEEPEDLIVIEKLDTPHGRQIATGTARIYETEEQLKKFEPSYLSERTEISQEKKAEKDAEEEKEKEESETKEESNEEE